jgi:hypothetical protein
MDPLQTVYTALCDWKRFADNSGRLPATEVREFDYERAQVFREHPVFSRRKPGKWVLEKDGIPDAQPLCRLAARYPAGWAARLLARLGLYAVAWRIEATFQVFGKRACAELERLGKDSEPLSRFLERRARDTWADAHARVQAGLLKRELQTAQTAAQATEGAAPPADEAEGEPDKRPVDVNGDIETLMRQEAVVLGSDVAGKMLQIARDTTKTADERQRLIYALDNRALGWNSCQWHDLMPDKTERNHRKTDWWIKVRPGLLADG